MKLDEALKSVENLSGQEKIDALKKINADTSGKLTFKQKLPAYFAIGCIIFLILMMLL